MGKQAVKLGASTCFFTRNPRGGNAKAIDPEDVKAYLELAKEQKFVPSWLMRPTPLNACAAKEEREPCQGDICR